MKKVLYITRTGMMEPLGQSQVLPYLKKLSREFDITLISFERVANLRASNEVDEIRRECSRNHISWKPKHFRHGWRVLAASWNMAVLFCSAFKEVCLNRPVLIHARAYLPAVVAMSLKSIFSIPFVFDMRALWPEELITSGRLRRASRLHKVILWAEHRCLREAVEVVVLTHAARSYLNDIYPAVPNEKISVIPTCADLDRFSPATQKACNNVRIYSCIGSVLSGWFRIELLAEFFKVAAARDSDSEFEVVSRDDPAEIRKAMGGDSSFQRRFVVHAAKPAQMPRILSQHTVNVMFYEGGAVSELGRCPTRLAEALGCGLPIVANSGVGDVAEILNNHNIGVVIDEECADWAVDALDRLDQLISDPDLSVRCRQAAEAIFGLDRGAALYNAIYRRAVPFP
jgi:glycosyltransferase involved in cell wall biosynthesis